MRVSLVTLGDPDTPSGGYLYHKRLAELAPCFGAAVRFVSVPVLPFPLPALAGHRVIEQASAADVIVIDSIAAAYVAPWLRLATRPVAGMLHQAPGGIDHGWARTHLQAWLDVRAYARMRTVLVASDSLKKVMRRLHPDVRLVAPGRDVATTPDPEVHDLRRGRDAAFLCVGNWVARKGITELLDAFATLPERSATLHLVGDGSVDARYTADVERRLRTLGDRAAVHGVVPKERVAAFYRDADVFVMPSYREPYGTVYGEAMAAGLPVVGWRAGNLPHLAEDSREGFVLERGDLKGLADALLRLADDAELRTRMGDAARERARAFPTWAETAERFFSALRGLLNADRGV